MTTLPTTPSATPRRSSSTTEDSNAVPSAVLRWRPLRKVDGAVLQDEVEARLDPNSILIQHRTAAGDVTTIVLPAASRMHLVDSNPGTTLLEWLPPAPADQVPLARILFADGHPPLVRTDLLDRLEIGGGRYDAAAVECLPPHASTSAPSRDR